MNVTLEPLPLPYILLTNLLAKKIFMLKSQISRNIITKKHPFLVTAAEVKLCLRIAFRKIHFKWLSNEFLFVDKKWMHYKTRQIKNYLMLQLWKLKNIPNVSYEKQYVSTVLLLRQRLKMNAFLVIIFRDIWLLSTNNFLANKFVKWWIFCFSN